MSITTEGIPAAIEPASLADLPAFKLGNATDEAAGTGTTVIVAPAGVIGAVDVRGGGPATRETDLLRPDCAAEQVFAVMLSGGSAFGLAAADGVMGELEQHGIGLAFAGHCVPIVPSACLFDLLVGDSAVRPDASFGRTAVAAALAGEPFREGNVGAGTGASVGKLLGLDRMMKSGLGCQVLRFGEAIVGAVVAVNACGSVVGRAGGAIAGPIGDDGVPMQPQDSLAASLGALRNPRGMGADAMSANTTIGCVFTNVKLTKAQAAKVASMTHDAYARAITPVHTPNDGDTAFCLTSGEVEATDPVDMAGILACEAMQEAIYRAIYLAKSAYGLPAATDMRKGR